MEAVSVRIHVRKTDEKVNHFEPHEEDVNCNLQDT